MQIENIKTPAVSIITPLFNREKLVAATIESVVNQTFSNWEMIIVDDGSTDESFQIAENQSKIDNRIKVLHRADLPKGACTCRNEGLAKAEGRFVIFLDSDDLLKPECLENRLLHFEKNPACDFIVFLPEVFCEEPGDCDEIWGQTYEDYLSGFLEKPAWITISPIWKRDWIERIGGWREGLPSYQDWELHIRALTNDPEFQVIPDVADAYLRRGDDTRISVQSERNLEHLRSRKQLLQDIFKLLQEKNLLNETRQISLSKQFLSVSTLSRLAGDQVNGKDCVNQIGSLGLVSSKLKLLIIKCYAAFEGARFFRLPVIAKTIRRFVKLIFVTLVPKYVL